MFGTPGTLQVSLSPFTDKISQGLLQTLTTLFYFECLQPWLTDKPVSDKTHPPLKEQETAESAVTVTA